MKRFILALAIGCFSLFVFSGIIEYCQLRVGNNYSYKYWYMEEHRDKIRTLLLGNSTIENAINPQLIGDSTFNLASSSRWIYYDFQLLDKYISDMPNLKQVIFGMNYPNPFHHSFHFSDSDINEHEKHMYEKFMHIKYDDNSNHWLGLFRGYIDYRTLFVGHLCDSLGYEAVEGQSALWQTEHNIDPNVIYNEHAQEELAEFTNYLKDMARLCHIHKVRFIVITPPCHDSYNVNVRQEGLDLLHGIIENVRSEYPVEYIDYLQDEDYRADSLYYNCSHLNSVGADMFALRVKKDFGL
jgi:hypothetical protein